MNARLEAVRVIDIDDLGLPALVVNAPNTKLLLLDAKTNHDERMSILERFFPLGEDT